MNKTHDLQKYRMLYAYLKMKSLFTASEEEINKDIMNIDGSLLQFVKDEDKTFEVCFEAVLNNNDAIKFIPRSLSLNDKCTLHKAIKKSNKSKEVKSPVKLVNPVLNRI